MDFFASQGIRANGGIKKTADYKSLTKSRKKLLKKKNNGDIIIRGKEYDEDDGNDKGNSKNSFFSDEDMAFLGSGGGGSSSSHQDINYLKASLGDKDLDDNNDDDGFDSDDLEQFGLKGLNSQKDDFDDINQFLQEDKSAGIKNKALMEEEIDRINTKMNNKVDVLILEELPSLNDIAGELQSKQQQIDTIETFKNFFEDDTKEIKKTQNKYPNNVYIKLNKKIPTPMERPTLLKRISTPIRKLVPRIIDGSYESCFYQRALSVFQSSDKAVLSGKELSNLNWNEFSVGYLGSETQQWIAKEISRVFPSLSKLRRTSDTGSGCNSSSNSNFNNNNNKNKDKSNNNSDNDNNNNNNGGDNIDPLKVVRFWGKDFFTLYVLSPEIAAQLAKLDFSVSVREAYDVLSDTTDFGRFVVDRQKATEQSVQAKEEKHKEIETTKQKKGSAGGNGNTGSNFLDDLFSDDETFCKKLGNDDVDFKEDNNLSKPIKIERKKDINEFFALDLSEDDDKIWKSKKTNNNSNHNINIKRQNNKLQYDQLKENKFKPKIKRRLVPSSDEDSDNDDQDYHKDNDIVSRFSQANNKSKLKKQSSLQKIVDQQESKQSRPNNNNTNNSNNKSRTIDLFDKNKVKNTDSEPFKKAKKGMSCTDNNNKGKSALDSVLDSSGDEDLDNHGSALFQKTLVPQLEKKPIKKKKKLKSPERVLKKGSGLGKLEKRKSAVFSSQSDDDKILSDYDLDNF